MAFIRKFFHLKFLLWNSKKKTKILLCTIFCPQKDVQKDDQKTYKKDDQKTHKKTYKKRRPKDVQKRRPKDAQKDDQKTHKKRRPKRPFRHGLHKGFFH